MVSIVRMPEVFAGSTEAALSSWLVEVGDRIEVGRPLAEIETEKAIVEYAAETSGIVGRTLIAPGDSTNIGDPILVLLEDGDGDSDIEPFLAELGLSAPSSETSLVAPPVPTAGSLAQGASAVEIPPGEVALSIDSRGSAGRHFASPIARRIARDAGLDLSPVRGTGPGGRITRRDVEALVAANLVAAKPIPAVPAAPTAERPVQAATSAPVIGEYEEIPHSGMRRAIARRLTESKSTVPHFYLAAECRVDELFALRARINETSPVRISVNDFVVKAAAAAFVEVPEANVTWADTAMRKYRTVDISVAVATEAGLVTPVLRAVETLSLSAISSRIAELATRARDRRLRQDELEGGSFSVTNLGMYGTVEFSAILNPPQSGILAVGTATQQPVVTDGEVNVATVMRFTLSVDHRAVDGALAATWLSAFSRRIENPLSMLV